MDHLLKMREAVEIIAEYEEIVYYGDSCFYEIKDKLNLVVSCMKYQGKYLISVSPNYNPMIPLTSEGHFKVRGEIKTDIAEGVNTTAKILDLRLKTELNFEKDEEDNYVINFDKLRSTVILFEIVEDNETSKPDSPFFNFLMDNIWWIIGGAATLLSLFGVVFIVIVFVVICCAVCRCKKKERDEFQLQEF